jgi:hypothetical protein
LKNVRQLNRKRRAAKPPSFCLCTVYGRKLWAVSGALWWGCRLCAQCSVNCGRSFLAATPSHLFTPLPLPLPCPHACRDRTKDFTSFIRTYRKTHGLAKPQSELLQPISRPTPFIAAATTIVGGGYGQLAPLVACACDVGGTASEWLHAVWCGAVTRV